MRCTCHRHPLHCIIPPFVLEHMAESSDPEVRKHALDAISASSDARATRRVMQEMPTMASMVAPAGRKHRLVYDAGSQGLSFLPGRLVRSEGDKPTKQPAVDEAYSHGGSTYDFYQRVFSRNSLDGAGMTLVSSVHVGLGLNNAFWTGQQMAYGDGDGSAFRRFTRSLDVVAHELTHGVIAHECNLVYADEPGALNEHFADVFGVLAAQWKRKQTAATADWLVGKALLVPRATARALRDFGPGKAFERDPLIGTDPQPKHLRDKYTGGGDYGGVHINSGIPNHAFYLFARSVGGRAWEVPGAIWYDTMRQLSRDSQFADMVRVTLQVAAARHGSDSAVTQALRSAWKQVGL